MSAHDLRSPCARCGGTSGAIETRSGQDCVFCSTCGKFCYNAPRVETGREVRKLATRPDIKPSTRARILLRDNSTCVICHRSDLPLDVGHIISVDAGRGLGLTDAQLWHDENLAAMCQPCNSGIGNITIPLRLLAAIVVARIEGAA